MSTDQWPIPAASAGAGAVYAVCGARDEYGLFRSIPFDYLPEPDGQDYVLGFNSTFFIYCARSRSATWRCDD